MLEFWTVCSKNVIVPFDSHVMPMTSMPYIPPFMSQEMLPLTCSPEASSWDLKMKLPFSCFPLHLHPQEFHRQNLAGDFVGDTWSHTDSAVALLELDESFERLTGLKTCCYQHCEQVWHMRLRKCSVLTKSICAWSPVAISLYDFYVLPTTCDWGKVATLSIAYYCCCCLYFDCFYCNKTYMS